MQPTMASTPARKFMSEAELEELTNIKRRTWQRLRFNGKGPRFYRIGSSIHYDLGEVMSYIENRAVDPTPSIQ
jgi:predicted DNA-binding transcriptional regulator AlpA